MARRQKHLQAGGARIAGAITGLTAVVLMLGMSEVECALNECLSAAGRIALGALPSMVLAGWRVLQTAHTCGTAPLLEGVLRISGSCWALIATVVAGI
jgi:hypothetical protein